jgi:threonine dehydrogenase-like Zn-dependent dehydrogenase
MTLSNPLSSDIGKAPFSSQCSRKGRDNIRARPALEAALDLIATRKINIKDTITHTLPLEQIQAGFKIVAGAGESLKVVLVP